MIIDNHSSRVALATSRAEFIIRGGDDSPGDGFHVGDEYWDEDQSTCAKNRPQLLGEFRGIDLGPTAAPAGVGT